MTHLAFRKSYRADDDAEQSKQVRKGMLSPVEFEKQHKVWSHQVYETRGYSVVDKDLTQMCTDPASEIPRTGGVVDRWVSTGLQNRQRG